MSVLRQCVVTIEKEENDENSKERKGVKRRRK
jgi:hypothetical protein